MTTAAAKAIEQIKRSARVLRSMARDLDARDLWEEAQALHAEADRLIEQAEAIELDAQDENAEGELLAA